MDIKVYGADWCPDCLNAKNFLFSKGTVFSGAEEKENIAK